MRYLFTPLLSLSLPPLLYAPYYARGLVPEGLMLLLEYYQDGGRRKERGECGGGGEEKRHEGTHRLVGRASVDFRLLKVL